MMVFRHKSMPNKPPEIAGFGFNIRIIKHKIGSNNFALRIKIIIILDIYSKMCYIMNCVEKPMILGGAKMNQTFIEAFINMQNAILKANRVKAACQEAASRINGEKYIYTVELDLVEAV